MDKTLLKIPRSPQNINEGWGWWCFGGGGGGAQILWKLKEQTVNIRKLKEL